MAGEPRTTKIEAAILDPEDAEVARILGMSDDEILAEAAAEGRDIHAEAERMRRLFAQVCKDHPYV